MLTNDTKKIISYLDDNNYKKIKSFRSLELLYKYLNGIQNNYEIINNTLNHNSDHLNFINPFISEKITYKIKSLKNNQRLILKINGNEITINIYYNDKDIQLFIYNIIIVISYIVHLFNKNIGSLNINYYLTDLKKNISGNISDGLTHEHINNGCCNTLTNTIDIWRKEEIMKVTIHELFHLFNCDKSLNDNSFIIDMYQKRYNITSSKINTFEAYTEIWANILNCYFLSRSKYEVFIKYFSIEKEWCLLQCEKIYNLLNVEKSPIDINKYTNVLAYFIIRCELYNHLENFITIFIKNICCDSNKYFIFLKNTKKCKKTSKFKMNKKNYIYKTLRMSAIEFKLF